MSNRVLDTALARETAGAALANSGGEKFQIVFGLQLSTALTQYFSPTTESIMHQACVTSDASNKQWKGYGVHHEPYLNLC